MQDFDENKFLNYVSAFIFIVMAATTVALVVIVLRALWKLAS